MARTIKSLSPAQAQELRMAPKFVEVTYLSDLAQVDRSSLRKVSLWINLSHPIYQEVVERTCWSRVVTLRIFNNTREDRLGHLLSKCNLSLLRELTMTQVTDIDLLHLGKTIFSSLDDLHIISVPPNVSILSIWKQLGKMLAVDNRPFSLTVCAYGSNYYPPPSDWALFPQATRRYEPELSIDIYWE